MKFPLFFSAMILMGAGWLASLNLRYQPDATWFASGMIVLGTAGLCLAYLFRNRSAKRANRTLEAHQHQIDLLEQKIVRKNESLQHSHHQAEEANMIKQQFFASISHDFQTPLNTIFSVVHLMEDIGFSDPEQEKMMGTMKMASQTLRMTFSNLLDIHKIRSGGIRFSEVKIELPQLLSDICDPYKLKASHKGISFEVEIDESAPLLILGDPYRFRQIIGSILDNAVKFTESGQVKMSISTVSWQDRESVLEFSVSDTGIGIPETKLEKIFHSFTHADRNISQRYGGSGLGLTIAKMLLELQGSKILVHSEHGQGSLFYFNLTCKTLLSKEEQAQQTQKQTLANSTETENLKGVRVLVVEDNEVNSKLACKILGKWGIDTLTAFNGKEAYEQVQNEEIDLVLMDIRMPVMDGIEATKQIRTMRNGLYKDLPIIALTASAIAEEKKEIEESGMNGVVFKPFNPKELRQQISHFVRQRAEIS
ncbi:response regulator [Pontibacter sp. G13]|uniref:response regulator n=1 Tax=Pontibacter sp. G13 TaxID=3074898 RepID=UPI002889C539|nr:response regulator [Pontibacter sp. G13]WNJ18864.1 response regulator [Pontibacter sp. G13]